MHGWLSGGYIRVPSPGGQVHIIPAPGLVPAQYPHALFTRETVVTLPDSIPKCDVYRKWYERGFPQGLGMNTFCLVTRLEDRELFHLGHTHPWR